MTDGTAQESPAKKRYHNRELSWLLFDERVLNEATRTRHPLLERAKFLAISASNLDEFFMVRVAGLLEQVGANVTDRSADGLTPEEQLSALRPAILGLMLEQHRILGEELVPGLAKAGVHIQPLDALDYTCRDALNHYFDQEVFPVCTPLGFDPGHPFPFMSNLSVNLAVVLDDPEGSRRFARLKIPTVVPRLVAVPNQREATFVWLDELIIANLHKLFAGMTIREVHPFRVVRDADIEIQDLEAGDLLESVQVSLEQRRFGSVVSLQIHASMPDYLRTLLIEKLPVDPADVYVASGPLGLSALMELTGVNRPDLKDVPFVPHTPPALRPDGDLFSVIRESDVLLHHPFDSFAPVVDLLERAARDPAVLAVKQTLYRVGPHSPVVNALLRAAQHGKQVAVLVELKARFDEENNIEWAKALERAGVHVTYGLLGLKTHCKLLLIVRRDREGLRRYVHIGTGNYNPATARLYTDLGLLTCNREIAADVSELFNYLTGYSRKNDYRRLLVAPMNMRQGIITRIRREVDQHRDHGGGRIIFKMNSLVDAAMTEELYRAVEAGVEVDLVIRGICALSTGIVQGGNLRVKSVLGRFLEHSRIFYFRNGGNDECLIGSADIMPRNLDHRVEVLVPVLSPHLLAEIRDDILPGYLRDEAGSYILNPDGCYKKPDGGFDVQSDLLLRRTAEPETATPLTGSERDDED